MCWRDLAVCDSEMHRRCRRLVSRIARLCGDPVGLCPRHGFTPGCRAYGGLPDDERSQKQRYNNGGKQGSQYNLFGIHGLLGGLRLIRYRYEKSGPVTVKSEFCVTAIIVQDSIKHSFPVSLVLKIVPLYCHLPFSAFLSGRSTAVIRTSGLIFSSLQVFQMTIVASWVSQVNRACALSVRHVPEMVSNHCTYG